MSRLQRTFADPGHKALVAYITMGFPTMEDTLEVVPLLAEHGCDVVELGIPFSDPMADGATIQEASYVALQQGTTPRKCLEAAAKLRSTVSIPLLFMTYFNPVLSYGTDGFCRASAGAGIDGFIVTDVPPEESEELEKCTRSGGMDLIYLLAPTSTPERIKLVAQKASGFIYLVSVTGVTGARQELPSYLEEFVARVRKEARQPLCIGFGISSAPLARRMAGIADGVVIGSRLVEFLGKRDRAGLKAFVSEVRQALDSGK